MQCVCMKPEVLVAIIQVLRWAECMEAISTQCVTGVNGTHAYTLPGCIRVVLEIFSGHTTFLNC